MRATPDIPTPQSSLPPKFRPPWSVVLIALFFIVSGTHNVWTMIDFYLKNGHVGSIQLGALTIITGVGLLPGRSGARTWAYIFAVLTGLMGVWILGTTLYRWMTGDLDMIAGSSAAEEDKLIVHVGLPLAVLITAHLIYRGLRSAKADVYFHPLRDELA